MSIIICYGLLLFLTFLTLQVVIWKLVDVKSEMLCLALIYILLPSLLLIALFVGGVIGKLDVLMLGLLYFALASAYIQTYPALREDIPSFRILFVIHSAAPAGISKEEIIAKLKEGNLFAQKIEDLQRDSLIDAGNDGRLELTPAGKRLAVIFKIYRKILGLRDGNG